MINTQIAVVIGFDGHISVVQYADERDMQCEEVSVTKEKCLALMGVRGKPAQPLPKESVTLRKYKHADGNTYLVGLRPGADQDTNFEDVINFVKGDKLLPFRWL